MTTELIPRQVARYGWRPDLPDNRDKVFRPRRKLTRLPSKVDLRTTGFMPPVYDQGDLGSCTANGTAACYEYEQKKQGLIDFTPSRLFIYYGEREIEGSTGYDAGAEIRDGMKVLNHLGVPDEKLWPYDVGSFTTKPPQLAYDDAAKHQTVTYASIDNRTEYAVKAAVAGGTPVVFGFTVYPWFENPDSAGVCHPKTGQSVLGGHCVCVVGYETIKRVPYAIVRNSWGDWADHGYCYIPLRWICDYRNADDFWAIQAVEG